MAPLPTRSAWSCENCRRRKVKCNSQDPCVHCTRRGEVCHWPANAQHLPSSLPRGQPSDQLQSKGTAELQAPANAQHLSSSPPRGHPSDQLQSTAELQARIERIEARLDKAGLGNLSEDSPPDTPPATTASNQQQRIEIHELADVSHGGPLQVDVHLHDDFDHHIIDTSPVNESTSHRSSRTSNKRADALRLMARVLPKKQHCDELLRSYLHNVEWIHHPLDVPTFQAEYESFWQHYDHSQNCQTSLQWLALLMVVLCLGNHFHPQRQSVRVAEELYAASHELLTCSDYLANHTLTAIQTLISMGLFLNNRGLSSTHHVQLALAIKMAVNLGFSKLDVADGSVTFAADDEGFFDPERFSMKERNADSELRRRVWWSLICQDYYTASSCNFTYSIHPMQSKTNLPLNLDDEELHSKMISSTVTGHSLEDMATASSYQLLKIPFARVAKAMIDLYNNDGLSYTAIIDVEKLLWATYDRLPEHFKWRALPESMIPMPASQYVIQDHLEWQRLFLAFTVHNRVLRLHRPFMARGYVDESMAHSRHATISSALACLDLARHGQRVGFPGLRWWVILIHIFTAGVALCIDYHFLLQQQSHSIAASDPSLIRLRDEQITRAVELLRSGADSSVAAARAASVIDSLVKQAVSHARERATAGSSSNSHGTKRRRLDSGRSTSVQASLSATEEHASLTTGSRRPLESTSSQPEDHDWQNTPSFYEWPGSKWDELFASFSDDNSYFDGGASAELFETMDSFANGFDSM